MSGSASTQVKTTLSETGAPEGCIWSGGLVETDTLSASTSLSPQPRVTTLLGHGQYRLFSFAVGLDSLSASEESVLDGHGEVNPSNPPPDPSICSLPRRRQRQCATDPNQNRFYLSTAPVFKGQMVLSHPSQEIVDLYCDGTGGDPTSVNLLQGVYPTSLRLSALNTLRTGRTLADSATITVPVEGARPAGLLSTQAVDTLTYRIKIKRLR